MWRSLGVVLLGVLVVGAAYGLGRVAGHDTATPEATVALGLGVGSELPLAVVHSEEDGPVDLRTLIDSDVPTILVIAQVNCGSCSSEAVRWGTLSDKYRTDRRFIGLLCDDDFDAGRAFRHRAQLTFETYLCDAGLLGVMARRLPAVYEIDVEKRVTFSAFGLGSSVELEHYIADSVRQSK